MSFSSIGTFACRALQQRLINYYGANTAEYKTMGSVALIKWLKSPQNTRGFKQITDNITGLPATVPGKLRAIAFRVNNPFCYDVSKVSGVTCETSHQTLDNPTEEVVFSFDNTDAYRPVDGDNNPLQLRFDEATLAKYCDQTNTDYITEQIARCNKRFIEALDKRVGELLELSVGKDNLGNSVVRLPFFANFNTQIETLNPQARWYLDQVYQNIGGESQYGLIGGQVLNKLITYAKWAGLNAAGIDLSAIEDINPYAYYDRNLDTVLGLNDFFLCSPGAAQLVTWNKYVGEANRKVTDLYTNGTFIDPFTGLEVDFEWRFDYNCGVWTYKPFIYMELAAALPGGCGIPDSNGILLIEDCSSGATPPTCSDSAS